MRTFVAALVFATANAGQAEQCAAYGLLAPWDDYTDDYKTVCIPTAYDADKVCSKFREDVEPSDEAYAANIAIFCPTSDDAATALTMGGAMIAIVGALAF